MASRAHTILGHQSRVRTALLRTLHRDQPIHPRWYACNARKPPSRTDVSIAAPQKPPPRLVPATSLGFWTCKSTWRRAAINTSRCLVGCTLGDFSTMWSLQTFCPEFGMGAIMAISSTSSFIPLEQDLVTSMSCLHSIVAGGVTTSMALETVLLRFGRDRLAWSAAANTAVGMSLISMLTMELAQNLVDYHLTGGAVEVSSPAFWAAAGVSMVAGFLTPLPYNYLRLKKFGKACH